MRRYFISKNQHQYRANLHCHSIYSDGTLSPEELKDAYKAKGYSILAITDHEHPKSHTALSDPDFLMLTGYEAHIRKNPDFDPAAQEIHINLFAKDPENVTLIYDDPTFCERYFKKNPKEYRQIPRAGIGKPRAYTVEYINEFLRMATQNGYLASYNHPAWSMEDEERIFSYENLFSIEMMNYNSFVMNRLENSGVLYDKMLRRGMRRFCHAGDDNHNRFPFDHPNCDSFGAWTMILAEELTYPAVIRAMETGEMYASSGPRINELYLEDGMIHVECSPASQITVFTGTKIPKYARSAHGEALSAADLPLLENAPYFRVSVVDEQGNTACTRGFFADEYM